MAKAVLRGPGCGEFGEIQVFQLFFGKPVAEFTPRPAARLQFLPKPLIGIELVHEALCEALRGREIKVRIHRGRMKDGL